MSHLHRRGCHHRGAGGAPPASAQRWTAINERQARLDDWIDASVRSGQVTPGEAEHLRGQFREAARLEAAFRCDGLSTRKRVELDRRFYALSRELREERHDQQTARGWFGGPGWTDSGGAWMSINQRQREPDRRVDTGVRLTDTEARRLRETLRDIARLEARYRRGDLTHGERADLRRRFDALALGVQWQSTDRRAGQGYGRPR